MSRFKTSLQKTLNCRICYILSCTYVVNTWLQIHVLMCFCIQIISAWHYTLLHSNAWLPTWSDEMLDSNDCVLSLDNLFFEKPIVHKVWVQRDMPHHPMLAFLSWINVFFPTGIYLTESHCTKSLVHGSWKHLHLFPRFRLLRLCRRRQSLSLPYTVCCALD